ncbi:MAG: nucleotide sugar dehydrogenase [Deltaproteobacteria bacterium]|nr:nucleotide sugar dehydrogenase [Deltaproteobacteria bacterium]
MSRLEELSERIESREARIGVIGLGYVGLPLSLEFAKAGFEVVGFDIDAEKVAAVQEGRSYIEDVPAKELAKARAEGKLDASTDFAGLTGLDVINICVPTPLTRTKDPDVSHMAKALEEIRRRLRSGQLVILGSTTYPGTTDELFVPMLEETGLKVGEDFCLAFAPERIDPANKVFQVRNVPKVIGGRTPLCTELAGKVFSTIFDEIVPVSSTQSAEMVKLLENTFVWEVIEAAATKPYGFMKFLPGPGLGGHCIPVDPSYLAWKMKSLNFPARFIDLATDINTRMPEYVVERVSDLLNEERLAVNGARLLILGVAYKKDVSDMRESPALDIIRLLAAKGADISYHDPHVPECVVDGRNYKNVDLTDEILGSADLAVVLTDHTAFDYQRIVDGAARVFDTRNATKSVEKHRERISKL